MRIPFLQQFVKNLPAGGKILDLGAGRCVKAIKLADRGFSVVAVDHSDFPDPNHPKISWHREKGEDFVEALESTPQYHGVLLRNIL